MAANGSSSASSHNTRNYTPLPITSPERPSTQTTNNNNSINNNNYDNHIHHQSLLQSPTAAGATTRSSRKSTVSSVAASTQSTVSLQPSHIHNEGFQYRAVRTLPTWVQEYDDEDESPSDLISPPPPLAHKETSSRPPQKSIHDSRRENTPVTPGPIVTTGSRWRAFVEDSNLRPQSRLTNSQRPVSSTHPQQQQQHHDEEKPGNTSGTLEWLEEGGKLDEPWLANQRKEKDEGGEGDGPELLFVSAKRRRIWYKRLQVMLLNNPIIPLLLRSSIWILSLLALALACNIFALSTKYEFAQKPSTIMAIVVDVVAMVYLIYITYDEYSGKPLGLRSPKAKMRLIMFDLFFIIFDSANTALAFDTLFDVRWSCLAVDGEGDSMFPNTERVNDPICRRQRALASFLFLALLSWVLTFTISVFRLVERVSRQV